MKKYFRAGSRRALPLALFLFLLSPLLPVPPFAQGPFAAGAASAAGVTGLFAEDTPLSEIIFKMQAVYGKRTPRAWGDRMPGITGNLPNRNGLPATPAANVPAPPRRMALTLDACGGPKGQSYDPKIIALLRELEIPAAIFVTNKWLDKNREIAAELAQDPLFTLEAHGVHHRPASVNGHSEYEVVGTRSVKELVEEVEMNARRIRDDYGKRPRWFRSGTAYYDEVAVDVIRDLGYNIAGFTVSADEGASLPAAAVAAKLIKAPDGAILLCHLNKPASQTGKGLSQALPALKKSGVRFVRLDEALAGGRH